MIRHLCDNGYVESAEKLQSESQVSLSQLDAADNIDMLGILQEYEEFYEIRFQRKPKLTRKVGAGDSRPASEQAKLPNLHRTTGPRRKPSLSSSRQENTDADSTPANGNDSHKPSSAPGGGARPAVRRANSQSAVGRPPAGGLPAGSKPSGGGGRLEGEHGEVNGLGLPPPPPFVLSGHAASLTPY